MRKIALILFLFLQAALKAQIATSDEVFTIVEKMPAFTGGEKAKAEYFQKNVIYPKIEKEFGVHGVVYVTFVVEKDGSISEVKCLKGVKSGPGINKEAIRVIGAMPKWQPGMQNGRAVRVQYNMPVKFTPGDTKELSDQQLQDIANAHYKKGVALADKQKFKEALDEFDYTIFYMPSDINTLSQRGKAFHNLKNEKAACDEWNKIKFLGSNQADEMLNKYCK